MTATWWNVMVTLSWCILSIFISIHESSRERTIQKSKQKRIEHTLLMYQCKQQLPGCPRKCKAFIWMNISFNIFLYIEKNAHLLGIKVSYNLIHLYLFLLGHRGFVDATVPKWKNGSLFGRGKFVGFYQGVLVEQRFTVVYTPMHIFGIQAPYKHGCIHSCYDQIQCLGVDMHAIVQSYFHYQPMAYIEVASFAEKLYKTFLIVFLKINIKKRTWQTLNN
jgi:hypothetical protein